MTAGVADLDRALRTHIPADPREAASCRRIIAYLAWLPRPFDETADPTHVTASAIVLDDDRRVLVHRHKRLGIWLQPGGHLDPGEDPAAAAVRETLEETGLAATPLDGAPNPLHVDVHEGPRGHVHLDLRYLLLADGAAEIRPDAGESADVRWLPMPDAMAIGDISLAAAVRRAQAVAG